MQMKFCAMNADHRVMNADKIYTEQSLVALSQISEAHVTQTWRRLSARMVLLLCGVAVVMGENEQWDYVL